ncbi:MAG TPA: hypothetical protein VFW20_01975 [Candidatus Limnocylindrales bacterium]|nr:hypothetical protein [Candidatus Limnocylindrales bacterium]
MTRVYVDVDAATITGSPAAVGSRARGSTGGASSAGGAIASAARSAPPDPAAVRSLQFLRDAGHRVVLVTPDGLPAPAALRDVSDEVLDEVPAVPPERAWYLTAEVERCTGSSARLRTVLIGAAPAAGSIHRCDAVARDVRAAALELLASEAMPTR